MKFEFPESDYQSFLQVLKQNNNSSDMEYLVSLFENLRRPFPYEVKFKASNSLFPGSFYVNPEMDEIWSNSYDTKNGWKLESDGSLTPFFSEPNWKYTGHVGILLKVNNHNIDTTDVESLLCSFYGENDSDWLLKSSFWQNRTHPFVIWIKQNFQQEIAKLVFSYRAIFQNRLNLVKASGNSAYRKQRAKLQEWVIKAPGGISTQNVLIQEDSDLILKIMNMDPAKIRGLQEIAQQIKREDWVNFIHEIKDLLTIHEVNSK